MNKRQIIGYFLLVCKESGIPNPFIKKAISDFDTVFDKYSEEEVEDLGVEVQLEMDVDGYGPFNQQIMEVMYNERLNIYERLFRWDDKKEGDRAIEIISIIQPLRKADLEELKMKYRGEKKDEVEGK